MKAREVRERLKGRIDPEALHVIEALAEQQSVFRQQLLELAMQLDSMVNIIAQFTVVAENMKNTVDSMKGVQGDDVDDPSH